MSLSALLLLCVFGLIHTQIVCAGEECVPDQFLCFPGLPGSFKISRFSSGRGGLLSQHLLYYLTSLQSLFPLVLSSCRLVPLLNVCVSDSCWLFSLRLICVCFYIHGVGEMYTQAWDHFKCLRAVYWRKQRRQDASVC